MDDIEMSTSIDDIKNMIFDDEIINNEILDEIDIDEIMKNQNIIENKFIKKISVNNNLKDKNGIPNFDNILNIYLKNLFKIVLPKKAKNKFFVFLIRIVQLIGILFLLFGSFLPNKLLYIHVMWCLHLLIFNELLESKSYVSLIVTKISNLKYKEIIPFSEYSFKVLVFLVLFISIIGIVIPKASLFRVIKNIINKTLKFD